MKLSAFMLAVGLCLLTGPALAGLTQRDIQEVGIAPAPGAAIPLDLSFRNAGGEVQTLRDALGGKPTLLVPVDYGCRLTCGPALTIISGVLDNMSLRPGLDYRLVILGLDAQSQPETAKAFAESRIGQAQIAATFVLTGKSENIRAVMDSIGYRYHYDDDNKAFAHPAALVVLNATGRVVRALSTLAFNETDLRLALTEASEGRIGGLLGRVSLLCYAFDPVRGIYTRSIDRTLQIASALAVIILVGSIAWLVQRSHRQGGVA